MKFYVNIFIVRTSAYGLCCSMLENDHVCHFPSQNWKIQDFFLLIVFISVHIVTKIQHLISLKFTATQRFLL